MTWSRWWWWLLDAGAAVPPEEHLLPNRPCTTARAQVTERGVEAILILRTVAAQVTDRTVEGVC